jgi:glycogen debranching enzyme
VVFVYLGADDVSRSTSIRFSPAPDEMASDQAVFRFHLGHGESAAVGVADQLERDAENLRERFNRDFWMEKEGYYALALDGRKQQVRTITSNPGHGL